MIIPEFPNFNITNRTRWKQIITNFNTSDITADNFHNNTTGQKKLSDILGFNNDNIKVATKVNTYIPINRENQNTGFKRTYNVSANNNIHETINNHWCTSDTCNISSSTPQNMAKLGWRVHT